MYPVVFFDALRVKIRDEATVRSKAVYLALAVLPDGSRDILGIWIEQTEGAKFWLKVFTDLKTRGCQDILIAVTDGLKGMERGAGGGLPADDAADLHRASASSQPRLRQLEGAQALAAALRAIYTAPECRPGAVSALDAFERGPWGQRFPDDRRLLAPRLAARNSILRLPARNSPGASTPPTRWRACTRGSARFSRPAATFPTDHAATKLIWLALRNITATWEEAAPISGARR